MIKGYILRALLILRLFFLTIGAVAIKGAIKEVKAYLKERFGK